VAIIANSDTAASPDLLSTPHLLHAHAHASRRLPRLATLSPLPHPTHTHTSFSLTVTSAARAPLHLAHTQRCRQRYARRLVVSLRRCPALRPLIEVSMRSSRPSLSPIPQPIANGRAAQPAPSAAPARMRAATSPYAIPPTYTSNVHHTDPPWPLQPMAPRRASPEPSLIPRPADVWQMVSRVVIPRRLASIRITPTFAKKQKGRAAGRVDYSPV
jgi:hypothetical protein